MKMKHGSGRKKSVPKMASASIKQSDAKLGGGKTKHCTGAAGRATPPGYGKVRKSSTNP